MTDILDIERVEEINLSDFQKSAIFKLFKRTFEVYPADRVYYNQLPHFRFLIWEKPNLIGHLAIAYRVISCGDVVYPVFGIVDLCVDQDYRSRQIASGLIHEAEKFARARAVRFLVLTTSTDALYVRNGFKNVSNACRWLMINNHASYGVVERYLGDGFMVKEVDDTPWPEGNIDLLGHMF